MSGSTRADYYLRQRPCTECLDGRCKRPNLIRDGREQPMCGKKFDNDVADKIAAYFEVREHVRALLQAVNQSHEKSHWYPALAVLMGWADDVGLFWHGRGEAKASEHPIRDWLAWHLTRLAFKLAPERYSEVLRSQHMFHRDKEFHGKTTQG